jgi:hypothetical protein
MPVQVKQQWLVIIPREEGGRLARSGYEWFEDLNDYAVPFCDPKSAKDFAKEWDKGPFDGMYK